MVLRSSLLLLLLLTVLLLLLVVVLVVVLVWLPLLVVLLLLLLLLLLLVLLVLPLEVVVLSRILRKVLTRVSRIGLGERSRTRLKVRGLRLESEGRRGGGNRVIGNGVAEDHRGTPFVPTRIRLLEEPVVTPLRVVIVVLLGLLLLLLLVAVPLGDKEKGSVRGRVLRVLMAEVLCLFVG